MGTLQFSEIKDEVRAAFAARTDLDTRLTRIINQAQKRLARQRNWKELYKLYTYTIPYTGTAADDKTIQSSNIFGSDSVRRIITARLVLGNGRSRKLERRPIRQWDRELPEPEYLALGRPEKYVLYGDGSIDLWRVPDQTYTSVWRGLIWPAALSGDTDTSDLDNKDDLIVAYACRYAALSLQLYDEADRWKREIRDLFSEIEEDNIDGLDQDLLPRFESNQGSNLDTYWNDPFIDRSPL